MKRTFCTCFDHNYMVYGLTLFRSLAATGMEFELFVFCLSDEAFEMLQGIDPRLRLIRLAELENADQELCACRNDRSHAEYIFTMSPCLPLFLFQKFPELDMVTYLDSDLYFFESPELLFQELGEKSLYIVEHHFAPGFENDILNGRFNVAFQIYRRTTAGIGCLERWRTQCLQWCFDRCEEGKFADQKYLDEWPDVWGDEVVVSSHPGADLAPWNMGNYDIALKNGKVTVDGKKLIFVHYQSFKLLNRHSALWVSWSRNKKIRKSWKFLPAYYLKQLRMTMETYPELFRNWKALFSFRGTAPGKREQKILNFVPGRFLKQLLHLLYVLWQWRHSFFFSSGK